MDKTVIFTVFSGFGGQIRVYNKTRKALILRVFHSLFNCDCTSDGGADHGVVAHAGLLLNIISVPDLLYLFFLYYQEVGADLAMVYYIITFIITH